MSRAFLLACLAWAVSAPAPVHADAPWRSVLYPETGYDPSAANLDTDKLLQDFSYAGYRAGAASIPDAAGPVFDVTAAPYLADPSGVADATAAIQASINAAGLAGGGVVYLPAGIYRLSVPVNSTEALLIEKPGVVLRGAGRGQTFLLNTTFSGMRYKSVIRVRGPWGASFRSGGLGQVALAADLLHSTRIIPVTSTASFAVGDTVVVRNNITDAWITEHGEADWLGRGAALDGLTYRRTVVAVDPVAKTLTVDAPTRYSLKLRDSARVRRLTAPLSEVGLEDFSIGETQNPSPTWNDADGDIPGTAGYDITGAFFVTVERARDSWVRRVSSFRPTGNTSTAHLLSSGIGLNETTHVTIEDCFLQRPQYGGSGGNGYLFCIINSAETLIRRCEARYSRHGFVITGLGSSGNVIHDCLDAETGRATGATGYMATEGLGSDMHKHFSQANLIDACTAEDSFFEARYRPFGSDPKHNLTAVHSVFWNTRGTGTLARPVVRSEQARYGYVIGTRGNRVGIELPRAAPAGTDPIDHVEGEGRGDTLEPASLFLDQRVRRLGPAVLLPPDPVLPFPANTTEIRPLGFTFAGEAVSADELQISWEAGPDVALAPLPGGGVRVRVPGPGAWAVDCVLTRGEFSRRQTVRVVAEPASPTTERRLVAVADAYVEGDAAAGTNFGAQTLIALKRTSVPRHTRRGLLRFDLAALGGDQPLSARLVLSGSGTLPSYAGWTVAVRPVLTSGWTETTVNWNNAPAFGAPFATFTPTPAAQTVIDLGAPVLAAWTAGAGVFEVALTVETQPDSSVLYYRTREQSDPELRPRLELEIIPAAARFSMWIASHPGVPVDAREPLDDPDADGMPNLLEMFLGRSPVLSETASPMVFSGGTLRFDWAYPAPASTRLLLEHSTDLGVWSAVAIEPSDITFLPGGGSRVEVPATPAGPRDFWRLHLQPAP